MMPLEFLAHNTPPTTVFQQAQIPAKYRFGGFWSPATWSRRCLQEYGGNG